MQARILVKPHRDRVAWACEVWPAEQTARLDLGQETRRFGEDTFGWYQLGAPLNGRLVWKSSSPNDEGCSPVQILQACLREVGFDSLDVTRIEL
jgi:hypothetical protein